ncbi:MAG TPA: hypothetical protein VKR30_04590 [Candidatus Limnocylindrales bacterium]|nr:hypothetical protein [Candidatus Limnocylindrales bacterium]
MSWDITEPEGEPVRPEPKLDLDFEEGALRDRPPDFLTPIDEHAPVSGHRAAVGEGIRWADAPEHDWLAASSRIMPVLRPPGSSGTALAGLDREALAREAMKPHASPLIDAGPADLAVAYAMRAESFDVLVNADHLLAWGIEPAVLRQTALANLGSWSADAPWNDELSGERRLVSSETGEGADAARILLPEVRRHLTEQLAGNGRIIVGLPDRDLLVAGAVRAGDEAFATLFSDFVVEQSGGADEPIDRRIFELVDGELQPYVP